MLDNENLLHIAFGYSAAGSLKQALEQLGRTEHVICEPDDLGYGPINPHSSVLRAQFFDERLGYEVDASFIERLDAFWSEATTTTASTVAWMSRRCVREYAGFLEFVYRRNVPSLVVDVAQINQRSMSSLSPETIRSEFSRASQMSGVEFQRDRATWKQLKEENSELRVLDAAGRLVSAPITFFDDLIMSFVTNEWQLCTKIIAHALATASKEAEQTGDLFLWSRLRTHCEEGSVESRGDILSMHESSVRRVR